MIQLDYTLKRFDWNVKVIYYDRDFNYRNIISILEDLGCNERAVNKVLQYCEDCLTNCGVTYTNTSLRETVIIIFKCCSIEELCNTLVHELYHFIRQLTIVEYTTEEEQAQLIGNLFMKLQKELKNLICHI